MKSEVWLIMAYSKILFISWNNLFFIFEQCKCRAVSQCVKSLYVSIILLSYTNLLVECEREMFFFAYICLIMIVLCVAMHSAKVIVHAEISCQNTY